MSISLRPLAAPRLPLIVRPRLNIHPFIACGDPPLFVERDGLLEIQRATSFHVIKALIANGADVDAPGPDGKPPLQMALEQEDLELVEVLLDAGANVLAPGVDGLTLISMALIDEDGENTELALRLIASGIDVNAHAHGEEPLLLVAIRNEAPLAVVQALIDAGANPNAVTTDPHSQEEDKTALYMAASRGNGDVFFALLAAGARIFIRRRGHEPDPVRTAVGDTPLLVAARLGHADIFAAVVLMIREMRIVQGPMADLIEAAATVRTLNPNRHLPIHEAAWNGRTQIVQMLLQFPGQSPELLAHDNYTVLHVALDTDAQEPIVLATVQALLAAGADITAVTASGVTPLQIAQRRGYRQCVEALRV